MRKTKGIFRNTPKNFVSEKVKIKGIIYLLILSSLNTFKISEADQRRLFSTFVGKDIVCIVKFYRVEQMITVGMFQEIPARVGNNRGLLSNQKRLSCQDMCNKKANDCGQGSIVMAAKPRVRKTVFTSDLTYLAALISE